MAEGSNPSWYEDGLNFTCTQCGNCCTGSSGYVWFDETERAAMAEHLGISQQQFMDGYARQLNTRASLKEIKRGRKYDCVFLVRDPKTNRSGCAIYPVRPKQCRTWPFWKENLASLRDYATAARNCPGMAKGLEGEGTFYPVEKVRILRDSTPH